MTVGVTYAIYFLLGVIITVGVGLDLYKNGEKLIYNLFEHKEFTVTVNRLLLTGYYLVNLGYVAITLSTLGRVDSVISSLECLSKQLGILMLILGYLHFQNIIILQWLSHRKTQIIQFLNN